MRRLKTYSSNHLDYMTNVITFSFMPISLYKKIDEVTALGVWDVTEAETWFLQRLDLVSEEEEALDKIKATAKRREWLGARWLLHYLGSGESRQPCLKDTFGKPYLQGSSTEISISHSNGKAAVLRSRQPAGIDIQKRVKKIYRIKHKFVNAKEEKWLRPDHILSDLHLIWGAKEALYKIYSKKKVDFCKELEIKRPDFESQKAIGKIYKNKDQTYDIHYQWMGDFILVYTVAQKH